MNVFYFLFIKFRFMFLNKIIFVNLIFYGSKLLEKILVELFRS